MFFVEKPLHTTCLIIVCVMMLLIGPSFEDFTSESIVEFTTFYVNLSVIFGAGIFMKGHVNSRFMLIFGFAMILNHYVFYQVLSLFPDNIYGKIWSMFFGTLPVYILFNYYNFIQCKTLTMLDKMGVNEKLITKMVGPIGTTNFMLTCASYATFWLAVDFLLAIYNTVYGLSYGLAPDERITTLFAQNNHFNIFILYDSSIVVIDAFFTVLLAYRVVKDQVRPDALGLGRNMIWSN